METDLSSVYIACAYIIKGTKNLTNTVCQDGFECYCGVQFKLSFVHFRFIQ